MRTEGVDRWEKGDGEETRPNPLTQLGPRFFSLLEDDGHLSNNSSKKAQMLKKVFLTDVTLSGAPSEGNKSV